MSYEDKFEVNVDEKANVLEVDVEVVCRPPHCGVSFYDISIVLVKLKKLGYTFQEKDCLQNPGTVRSDDGRQGNKKTYKFRLKGKVNKPFVKKTKPPVTTKPAEKAKKVEVPVEKAIEEAPPPPTKKINTKTTSDVLKEYAKKKNN